MDSLPAFGALESLADTYCAGWSESNATSRLAILRAVVAEDGTYVNPRHDLAGVQALAACIGEVLATWPGARFMRTSTVDQHHGMARFAWRMTGADGQSIVDGVDFAQLNASGKLQRIVGFYGPLEVRQD